MNTTETKPSIEDRVKKLIVDFLGVNPEEVTPEANMVNDLGADSLDTIELIMSVEEEFDIEIPDEEAERLHTFQQMVDYLNVHVKQPA